MTRRGEELEERLLEFAARIGKVVDALPNTHSEDMLPGNWFVAAPLLHQTMQKLAVRRASETSSTSLEFALRNSGSRDVGLSSF